MTSISPSRLVLASASAARQAMLAAAGLTVDCRPAHVDEDAIKRGARAELAEPQEVALFLAETKARRIAIRDPDALVIGADQILVCEGAWFDKPPDLAGARRQLQSLRGRTHTLVTAVVCLRGETRLWHHVARPMLAMRGVSDTMIDDYLAREGEAVLGCVGAYRIEGPGIQLFDRIDGDHFAILGLPLLPLLGFLRQHGALP